jgi:hypothetical protein
MSCCPLRLCTEMAASATHSIFMCHLLFCLLPSIRGLEDYAQPDFWWVSRICIGQACLCLQSPLKMFCRIHANVQNSRTRQVYWTICCKGVQLSDHVPRIQFRNATPFCLNPCSKSPDDCGPRILPKCPSITQIFWIFVKWIIIPFGQHAKLDTHVFVTWKIIHQLFQVQVARCSKRRPLYLGPLWGYNRQ